MILDIRKAEGGKIPSAHIVVFLKMEQLLSLLSYCKGGVVVVGLVCGSVPVGVVAFLGAGSVVAGVGVV